MHTQEKDVYVHAVSACHICGVEALWETSSILPGSSCVRLLHPLVANGRAQDSVS